MRRSAMRGVEDKEFIGNDGISKRFWLPIMIILVPELAEIFNWLCAPSPLPIPKALIVECWICILRSCINCVDLRKTSISCAKISSSQSSLLNCERKTSRIFSLLKFSTYSSKFALATPFFEKRFLIASHRSLTVSGISLPICVAALSAIKGT